MELNHSIVADPRREYPNQLLAKIGESRGIRSVEEFLRTLARGAWTIGLKKRPSRGVAKGTKAWSLET